MPANSFAAIRPYGRHDICAPARHNVRANHAGEFIRRYSPCGAHVSARRLHGACGFCYDTHNNLTLYVKNGST